MQLTREFVATLEALPKGTRVGIEDLCDKERREVRDHLRNLSFDPLMPRFTDDHPVQQPFYDEKSEDYWRALERECMRLGLTVVFLEDKEPWMRYNKAMIALTENNAQRRNLLVKEKRESNIAYDRKRIKLNHAWYQENILMRKIHEIERDDALLKAIQREGVDIVVAGLGHAEYWAHNKEKIQRAQGVLFDHYSQEIPVPKNKDWRGEVIFVEHACPDPKEAFELQSLERAVRLLEKKRFGEREPAFVGTWDVHCPYAGYFEMFVDSGNGKFQGEVVDSLGDADVEGERTDTELRFIKKYRDDRCSTSACKKEILYRGLIKGQEIIGFYALGGYLVECPLNSFKYN